MELNWRFVLFEIWDNYPPTQPPAVFKIRYSVLYSSSDDFRFQVASWLSCLPGQHVCLLYYIQDLGEHYVVRKQDRAGHPSITVPQTSIEWGITKLSVINIGLGTLSVAFLSLRPKTVSVRRVIQGTFTYASFDGFLRGDSLRRLEYSTARLLWIHDRYHPIGRFSDCRIFE